MRLRSLVDKDHPEIQWQRNGRRITGLIRLHVSLRVTHMYSVVSVQYSGQPRGEYRFSQLSVLTFLRPSVLIDRSPRLKLAACLSVHRGLPACVRNIPSASSQALPAPNPVPTHTGHVLRLNSSTENMTPKENPSADRTMKEEIARSHCNHPPSQ